MIKLNVKIKDAGNAMKEKEIIDFNQNINMNALRKYRISIGQKSQKIIKKLEYNDLKRKMEKSQLDRIIKEGCILNVEESKWLIDFWGKKIVAGILLMLITRHQIVHLNNALKIKERYLKKN